MVAFKRRRHTTLYIIEKRAEAVWEDRLLMFLRGIQ